MDEVVLVNERDEEIGTMDKMEAHRKGALHRAFSVLLFNSRGEVLMQKRAKEKYHSAGLWSNTCCSHPLPNENINTAVRRRLKEEMGIDVQPRFSFKFLYKISLDHNLIEHEIDYVFIGTFEGEPTLNKREAEDWRFISLDELRKNMAINPYHYSYWFKAIISHPSLEPPIH